MQIKDQVIIDGNAVYEIDQNCKQQINITEINPSKDNDWLQWIILFALMM